MPQQFSLPKPLLPRNLIKNFLFVKCLPRGCKSWGLLLSQLAMIRCLVFAFKSDAWYIGSRKTQIMCKQWYLNSSDGIVSWVLTIETPNRNLSLIVPMKSCKTQIMCKEWYLNSSDQLCLEYLLLKHQKAISHWLSQWKAAPYLGSSDSPWLFWTWMHLSEVLTKASQFPATILLCIVISSSSNNNSCINTPLIDSKNLQSH
jgi:hypothetical protein